MNKIRSVDSNALSSPPAHDWWWTAWAVFAAFGAYFCMYGVRKPFTAGTYGDFVVAGFGFKTLLVTSQVAGYTLSKFIGIKIVAEMPPARRALTMLALIGFAELALVLFGIVPRPWNIACLFLNGLPLGMVFGLVLGFLEGRRLTELLTAGLCASFILADGVTKSVGAELLQIGVPEDWMPAAAGAVFLVPFCIFVAMLSRIPPPDIQDVEARSERSVMSANDRWTFLGRYAAGLIPLVLLYLAVTIVRSIRADFAPEIWKGLGDESGSKVFSQSEAIVALIVLAVNGCAVLIADNRRAFFTSLATCGAGIILLAFAVVMQQQLGAFAFMVFVGLGLYLPYVAVHTTVFERLIALTRDKGNLGFLMTFADAFGYLGYVAVMLWSNFGPRGGNMLNLLTTACWATIVVSTVCLLFAWQFFAGVQSAVIELKPAKVPE